MAKKKFSPQSEMLRAKRAMETMSNDKKWRDTPTLLDRARSFSPSRIFGRAVNGIADAVSNLIVGTQIEQGDFVDANQPAYNPESDSVNAAEQVAQQDTKPASPVSQPEPQVEKQEQVAVQDADVQEEQPIEDVSEPEAQSVQYVSARMPETQEPVQSTPVSQQEELAGSANIVDVTPESERVSEFDTLPEQDWLQDFPLDDLSTTADVTPVSQTSPPPVADAEPVAQEPAQPQLTPEAEAVAPEPQGSFEESGSVSVIASVPAQDAPGSVSVDQPAADSLAQQDAANEQPEPSGEVSFETPEVDLGSTQPSRIPQSEPVLAASFAPSPASFSPVYSVTLASGVELPEADDSESDSEVDMLSGGQRRHDIASGKAKAGTARKARTQWSPDGQRKGKLSSGAEYDYDKPAGGFAPFAPMSTGLPDVEAPANPANNDDMFVTQADALNGNIDATANTLGGLIENMAMAISDLAVRLNHAEMILRRGGY